MASNDLRLEVEWAMTPGSDPSELSLHDTAGLGTQIHVWFKADGTERITCVDESRNDTVWTGEVGWGTPTPSCWKWARSARGTTGASGSRTTASSW